MPVGSSNLHATRDSPGLVGIGALLWVPLAIIVGCRGGACGHAWDTPPDSLRYQVYSFVAEHRLWVLAVFIGYGVAVVAAYRHEIAASFTRKAVLRVLALIAIALVLAGAGVLLSLS